MEDEEHILLHCPIYQEIRQTLFDKILTSNRDFMQKSNIEKLCFIFGNPEENIVRLCAKFCLGPNILLGPRFCVEVLRIRRNCLYK